jgi:hypothetical protein
MSGWLGRPCSRTVLGSRLRRVGSRLLAPFSQASWPHRDHIDLRDFLRTHPAHAARYGNLKHRLAALLQEDRPAYSQSKAELISEFLRQARH